MWVPFPSERIEVPADPHEDCRGHMLVVTILALVTWGGLLAAVIYWWG